MHSNYFSKVWPHGDFLGDPVAKTPRSQSRGSLVQSLLRELGATCHSEMIYRSWLKTARARTENSHTINKDPERVWQRWKIRHGTAETQCSQIHKFINMLSIKKIIKNFCLHSKNILTGEGKKKKKHYSPSQVKRQLRKTEEIFTRHIIDSRLPVPKIFLYVEKKTPETIWEVQQSALEEINILTRITRGKSQQSCQTRGHKRSYRWSGILDYHPGRENIGSFKAVCFFPNRNL